MSKATTLTLVDNMGLGDTTNAETSIHYDDIVRELGYQVILTEAGSTSQVSGTPTYTPPANTIRVLEIHGGYGIIDQTSYFELKNLLSPRMRDRVGRAIIWCHEHESNKDFRLTPTPNESDTLTVFVTQYQSTVPTWMEMPIALEILHREYTRESNHQDIDFAMLCRRLATMWFSLLGILWYPTGKK